MKKIIHIHQNKIRGNIKRGLRDLEPPIIVRTYKGVKYYSSLKIKGDCEVVYRPHDPLSCGARLWIETHGEVEGYHNDTKVNEDNISDSMEEVENESK